MNIFLTVCMPETAPKREETIRKRGEMKREMVMTDRMQEMTVRMPMTDRVQEMTVRMPTADRVQEMIIRMPMAISMMELGITEDKYEIST